MLQAGDKLLVLTFSMDSQYGFLYNLAGEGFCENNFENLILKPKVCQIHHDLLQLENYVLYDGPTVVIIDENLLDGAEYVLVFIPENDDNSRECESKSIDDESEETWKG